jgi:hypothetical protein
VTDPQHRLAIYDRKLDWLRLWLQGVVGPDPCSNR